MNDLEEIKAEAEESMNYGSYIQALEQEVAHQKEVLYTALRRMRVVETVVLRETLTLEDVWKKYVPQHTGTISYKARHSFRTLINNIDQNVTHVRKLLEAEVDLITDHKWVGTRSYYDDAECSECHEPQYRHKESSR